MVADIRNKDGKTQLIYKLPFRYGYSNILTMAQRIIDNYLVSVNSIRTSALVGSHEYEHRLLLHIRKERIQQCGSLQKEQGVLYLRGCISGYCGNVEFVWFNQTNIIGVLVSDIDRGHIADFDAIIEDVMS